MSELKFSVDEKLSCFHCHQQCEEDVLWIDDKAFCCYGCKTVFEILEENELCDFYTLDEQPGLQQKKPIASYAYLDEIEIQSKLVSFKSETFTRVVFSIPTIHCVSCIWLLENLHKIHSGVFRVVVNFVAKTASIDFNPTKNKLGEMAELIARLG
jgi:Cu+-exporting ATPase